MCACAVNRWIVIGRATFALSRDHPGACQPLDRNRALAASSPSSCSLACTPAPWQGVGGALQRPIYSPRPSTTLCIYCWSATAPESPLLTCSHRAQRLHARLDRGGALPLPSLRPGYLSSQLPSLSSFHHPAALACTHCACLSSSHPKPLGRHC